MNSNLRPSGIEALGDMAWGSHFCLFYETREDLLDFFIPFFRAGLEHQEFCLCVASEPLMAISREITDRKRAEEALLESESHLSEAQRVARLDSWTLDSATDTARWSEELYRIFDVDKTAFSDTYETFLSRVHPDDRARVLQMNAEARSSGKPFEVEYRIVTRSGQLKRIREVGYARKDRAGAISGLFGTAQDITDRKQTEEALSPREREILQLVAEGKTSQEIAERLSFSPKTVDTYRSRLMRKIGAENLVALVKFAIRHGVISLE
jgi:PAS domain S-box-containing protein